MQSRDARSDFALTQDGLFKPQDRILLPQKCLFESNKALCYQC